MKNNRIIVPYIIILLSLLSFVGITMYFFVKEFNYSIELVLKNDVKTWSIGKEYVDSGIDVYKNGKVLGSGEYELSTDGIVDTSTLGSYTINYKVKYNGEEYSISKTIAVVDDIAPSISVNVEKITRDYCTKKDKEKLTIEALDNYDGDISENAVSVENENVLEISIKDSSGNYTKKEIPIEYTNKPDSKFTLNGYSTMYIPIGTDFLDEGAIIDDGCGNKIGELIVSEDRVDTKTVGEYTLTYMLDQNSLTRKVIVYEPNITRSSVVDNEKVIYLTFDDGPGAYTKKVLDTLDKYNVKATFFVTHQFGSYVPLIKAEYERGHSVGVHTYTHKWNVYTSVDAYIDDFNKMNDVVENYTGKRSKIFRFPGGASNTISKSYAKGVVSAIASKMTSDGYAYFDWNVDSNDAGGATKDQIYNNVVKGVSRCNSCVVLMHDIKYNTASKLDSILKTLTSKGYKFGTLNENSPSIRHKISN